MLLSIDPPMHVQNVEAGFAHPRFVIEDPLHDVIFLHVSICLVSSLGISNVNELRIPSNHCLFVESGCESCTAIL